MMLALGFAEHRQRVPLRLDPQQATCISAC